jgi:hypothetical protein
MHKVRGFPAVVEVKSRISTKCLPSSIAEVKKEQELYLLSPRCASMENNGTAFNNQFYEHLKPFSLIFGGCCLLEENLHSGNLLIHKRKPSITSEKGTVKNYLRI